MKNAWEKQNVDRSFFGLLRDVHKDTTGSFESDCYTCVPLMCNIWIVMFTQNSHRLKTRKWLEGARGARGHVWGKKVCPINN